jgi:hypothetical protein
VRLKSGWNLLRVMSGWRMEEALILVILNLLPQAYRLSQNLLIDGTELIRPLVAIV